VSARRARETGCTLDEDARIAVIIFGKSCCRACEPVMSDKVFGGYNDLAPDSDSMEDLYWVVIVF